MKPSRKASMSKLRPITTSLLWSCCCAGRSDHATPGTTSYSSCTACSTCACLLPVTLIRPFIRYMSCVAVPFSHSSVSSQSFNLHQKTLQVSSHIGYEAHESVCIPLEIDRQTESCTNREALKDTNTHITVVFCIFRASHITVVYDKCTGDPKWLCTRDPKWLCTRLANRAGHESDRRICNLIPARAHPHISAAKQTHLDKSSWPGQVTLTLRTELSCW